MLLQLQDFPTLVRNQAASVMASCATLIDVTVGSVLRAVLEANAAVALWMQWLIMEVLSTTRAATSVGADLDSFVADFGLSRLGAVPASTSLRFSRATTGLAAVIPVGAVVRTGTGAGAQAFAVVADRSRAEWNGSGFVVAATAAELIVPAQALAAGQAGNVQAGVLVLLSTAIPGVDAVVNDYAATGGLDGETDVALRVRFQGYVDSRTRATEQAVVQAVQSVQQGLQVVVAERVDASGAPRAGYFTVVVDDGSGSPSDALLALVGAAVEAVRAVGASYGVIGPQLVRANVSMVIQGSAAAAARVEAAVAASIAGLPIGGWVIGSRLVQVAHDSDATVARVGGLTINGGLGDLVVGPFGRAVPGRIVVTAS